ncbi:MAG TPA: sigma-54 dependent transcriptional regulator [Pyrinomonadaceae bacterium]|nr:sigma-54 dependent transcriptional regulator [Pyrinomonadaceae bacterium]
MTPSRTSNPDTETFGMVGRDAKLRQIIEIIKTVGPSDAAVLIEGESGAGKQLIADAIHAQSHRCSGPLIRVNCAAIPRDSFEAELFASIEAANGGTLLIDEIAEIPSHVQSKLFRVLQEQKPCRLIASTSRNTTKLLEDGRLKKDLYFCISTIKISVPPLRERLDDVPLIVRYFLDRFNKQYKKRIRGVSQETMFCLLRYDWPGNIRELESVIERAVLFCSGKKLVPECLPSELQRKDLRNIAFVIPPLVSIEEIEREAIVQTLARTSGNVKLSARILQYPRPTFYRKLKKFGIRVERVH